MPKYGHRIIQKLINTRTGGGAKYASSGFSRIAEKRRRAAPPNLQYLMTYELHAFCENFDPRSAKARSLGWVNWPDPFWTLRSCHGDSGSSNGLKLSEVDTPIIVRFFKLGPDCKKESKKQHALNTKIPYQPLTARKPAESAPIDSTINVLIYLRKSRDVFKNVFTVRSQLKKTDYSTYNSFISDFSVSDLRSGQFRDPPIIN